MIEYYYSVEWYWGLVGLMMAACPPSEEITTKDDTMLIDILLTCNRIFQSIMTIMTMLTAHFQKIKMVSMQMIMSTRAFIGHQF